MLKSSCTTGHKTLNCKRVSINENNIKNSKWALEHTTGSITGMKFKNSRQYTSRAPKTNVLNLFYGNKLEKVTDFYLKTEIPKCPNVGQWLYKLFYMHVNNF